jgi:hypothetical protein
LRPHGPRDQWSWPHGIRSHQYAGRHGSAGRSPGRIADSADAASGLRWTVEGGKEAVASGIDLNSSITVQELANSGVVAIEKLAPTVAADRLELFVGTDDAGEQHGDKYAVTGCPRQPGLSCMVGKLMLMPASLFLFQRARV